MGVLSVVEPRSLNRVMEQKAPCSDIRLVREPYELGALPYRISGDRRKESPGLSKMRSERP